MAVPTISSVSPTVGHTGGRTLVQILGTGFRTPAPPNLNAQAPLPDPVPTVQVLFGGVAATSVQVASATELYCNAPVNAEGAVAVAVQNLDNAGVPIPGELASAAAAYTYQRTQLGKANDSDLTRLVRTLRRELARQVVEEVVFAQHTDWSDGSGYTLNLASLAKVPALVLDLADMPDNRFYTDRGPHETAKGGGALVKRRGGVAVDLVWTIVGVTNNVDELLNLLAATRLFFTRNPKLSMDRSATDPAQGKVAYEMEIGREGLRPNVNSGNRNSSNTCSFSGTFVVRGFQLDEQAGFTDDAAIERGWETSADGPSVSMAQTGSNYDAGPGTGDCR